MSKRIYIEVHCVAEGSHHDDGGLVNGALDCVVLCHGLAC